MDNNLREKRALDLPRQPDALPERPAPPPPSLLLYGILLAVAFGLVAVAFHERSDWPGLFANLATELIGAVVILILVERRLRENELQYLRIAPRRFRILASIMFSRESRLLYSYSLSLHARLEQVLRHVEPRASLCELLDTIEPRILLIGDAGTGKTMFLQMLARKYMRIFWENLRKNKTPLLFLLREWRSGTSLEEALYEHVTSFAQIPKEIFRSMLCNGRFVILLDGADEIHSYRRIPLINKLEEFAALYPSVPWIMSSRPNSSIENKLRSVKLPRPTEEEFKNIWRRMDITEFTS